LDNRKGIQPIKTSSSSKLLGMAVNVKLHSPKYAVGNPTGLLQKEWQACYIRMLRIRMTGG